MKKANKKNPTMIQITSKDEIIGHVTCKEFRTASGMSGFIGNIIKAFNDHKQTIGEPERATQVINLADGTTI